MKKIFKKCNQYGWDIALGFALLLFIKSNIVLLGLLLLYIVVRSFVVKYYLIPIFVNVILLISIYTIFNSFELKKESDIIVYLLINIILFIVVISQYISIFARNIMDKYIRPPKTNTKLEKIVITTGVVVNIVDYIQSKLVLFFYPIIIVLTIIASFGGMYKSLNEYYESKNDVYNGIFYTTAVGDNANSRIGFKENTDTLNSFIGNDYFYFSAVTYYTVGYGDIISIGKYFRLVNIVEMVVSGLSNITLFAMYSSFFYEFLRSKKTLDYEDYILSNNQ